LVEEEEGVEAERTAVSVEHREVGNGGDGEVWPG
jgi:hypothetical protein